LAPLQFSSLRGDARLLHGISTRPWNVSFSVGAAHGDPREGRRALLEKVGIDPARTVVAGQVHGTRLRWVSSRDAGTGAFERGQAMPETDALATTEPGVGLLITAADCPPVLLWDPAIPVLALVHCGWRGTAAGIVGNVISELAARGASIDRLRAAIGPGIGACCYEVGGEVADRVPRELRGAILRARPQQNRPQQNRNATYLDLPAWIGAQIVASGIPPARIERMELCTSCRTDLFFSHRAERGSCGRFGLAAAIAQ
jgi:YfiH family protein